MTAFPIQARSLAEIHGAKRAAARRRGHLRGGQANAAKSARALALDAAADALGVDLRVFNPGAPRFSPRGEVGALNVAQQDAAIAMVKTGIGMRQVAAHFGVTKNVIIGIWHRSGNSEARGPDPTTLFDRCDALDAAMDAVLAATLGVGRLSNEAAA